MKIRPVHGAYICNAFVIAMLWLQGGLIPAVFGFFLLTGTITFCQAEWDK